MLEQQLLAEFGRRIRAETAERLAESDGTSELDQAAALAEVMIGYLEEAGSVSEHESCVFESTIGRSRCRIVAYALPDDSTRLELFTAAFMPEGESTLPSAEVGKLSGRAARFFEHAAKGDGDRFVGSADASAAAALIFEQLERIEDLRVHILTNGQVKDQEIAPVEILGRPVEFQVYDLGRLSRISAEEVSRDAIVVDFTKLLGRPIPCLEMKPTSSEYATFLLILPGDLLYRLYDQYGPKLLEFNVRSFLQVQGGVNKGIRETLREQPDRFLAYNNGLTATADEIEVGTWSGETVIHSIRGLQVVNGGQTLASIHRARKVDKLDIGAVSVAMKLTRVQPDKLAEFVPLIAKYANTQNVIQVADLSANSEFHIRMQQLSERVWCPGERTRWFYERARGSYVSDLTRTGTTPAKKREFERECPKSQRFGKTDLAKYLMAWWQRPQTVSRGAQKNFSFFMEVLGQRQGAEWQPDEDFYRGMVSQALIFKAAASVVRKAKLESYGAQVTGYIVAKLAADFGDEVDLEEIWDNQAVSGRIVQSFGEWAPKVHAEIVAGAGRKNVGEWCKKDECWEQVRAMVLDMPLPEKQSSTNLVDQSQPSNSNSRGEIALCVSLDGPTWAKVIEWSSYPGRVAPFDRQVAHTISGLALNGWLRQPSWKQAKCAARVLQAAAAAGIIQA